MRRWERRGRLAAVGTGLLLGFAVGRGLAEGAALHAAVPEVGVDPGSDDPGSFLEDLPRRVGVPGVGHTAAVLDDPSKAGEEGEGEAHQDHVQRDAHKVSAAERCFELRAAEVRLTECGAGEDEREVCGEGAAVASIRATFCCPEGGMAEAHGVKVSPLSVNANSDGEVCTGNALALAGGTVQVVRSTGSMRVVAVLDTKKEEKEAKEEEAGEEGEQEGGEQEALVRAGEVVEVFDEVDAGRPLAFTVVTAACPEGAAWGAAALPADYFDFDAGFCS